MKVKKTVFYLISIICAITIAIAGCSNNTVEFNEHVRSAITYDEIHVSTSPASSRIFIIRETEGLEDIRIFFNDVQLIKLSKVDENEKVTEEFMQLKKRGISMMEVSFKQITEDEVVCYNIYVDRETGYVYDFCFTENDKLNDCNSFEINHYYKSTEPIDVTKFLNFLREKY